MAAGAGLRAPVMVWYFRQKECRAVRLPDPEINRASDVSGSDRLVESAVMAMTDQDSLAFADQACKHRYGADAELMNSSKRRLLDRAECWPNFAGFCRVPAHRQRPVDMAVQNTNVKAYALAWSGAANEMDAALSRIVAQSVNPTSRGRAGDAACGERPDRGSCIQPCSHRTLRDNPKMDKLKPHGPGRPGSV
jgi:hypothetical protein